MNVPSPSGSKASTPNTRFIPREELSNFQPWQPGAIDGQERRAAPRTPEEGLPTVEEWRAKVHEARQMGYQDGYRDGLVALEGFKQSFAGQVTGQLGQLIASFDHQLTQLEGQMAESIARAATLLARQVLRQELSMRPEAIVGLAQDAVSAVLTTARHVTVRVHPDDLPMVTEGAQDALQARGARVVADAAISRGGCRIESDADALDATLEKRWALAAEQMGVQMAWEPSDAHADDDTPAQP